MKADEATTKFMDGLNCAQSVAISFCKELNIEEDLLRKITSGFGAGIGRRQEVCGAVSGGIMALGLKYDSIDFRTENKEIVFLKVNEFINEFTDVHGSIICRQLLNGVDLGTVEGQKAMKEELKRNVCAKCVHSAVQILERMI